MYTSTCCHATLQTYDNRIEQILKLRSLSCRPQYAACWRSSDPAMFVNTADSSSVFIHVHIHLLIQKLTNATLHTHGPPLSGTTQVSRYQKGKTNLDFIGARDSGISWAICKSAPRSRQITTPVPHHSVFLQAGIAGCPSCRPTNSVKALKALHHAQQTGKYSAKFSVIQHLHNRDGKLNLN